MRFADPGTATLLFQDELAVPCEVFGVARSYMGLPN